MNKKLGKAKISKADEFFTQLSDIEEELFNYTNHFPGKTVLCNCDDPRQSNFFRYFRHNFERLRLKKLIATNYKSQNLFSAERAIYFEYDGKFSTCRPLHGDGDFRSAECVEILKQADIVVTNPPFSLFREYIAQLMKYEKRFLVIGSILGFAYKGIFPLFKDEKIWLGANLRGGGSWFGIPDYYPLYAGASRIDPDGKKYVKVCVRWFTNLNYEERREDLITNKKYLGNESGYPKYDNFEAIHVNRTEDIPMDYEGVMGVPVTFLDKYNPEQFEIVGITGKNISPVSKHYINMRAACHSIDPPSRRTIKTTDAVLLHKDKPSEYHYVADNADGFLTKIFTRILIKSVRNGVYAF